MCRSTELNLYRTQLLAAVLMLAMAGCASNLEPVEAPVEEPPLPSATEVPTEQPAVEEQAAAEEARTFALPDEQPSPVDPSAQSQVADAPAPPPPANADAPSNPAVVALLDTAAAQARSGDAEQAAATLERALRIEPRNPWLWHRLAVLRMQQGRYDQALEFATRSNTLAGGDARLLQGNQQVIDQCRAALAATRRG